MLTIAEGETLLDMKAVLDLTGLSRAAVYAQMRRGDFPLPLKLGPSAIRWRRSGLDAWLSALPEAKGDLGQGRPSRRNGKGS